MLRADRGLDARTAVSLIPPEVFKLHWEALFRARWRHASHITLGEGRGALALLQRLAATEGYHDKVVVALMDNEGWSSATAKGRSSTPSMNKLLRVKAALEGASGVELMQPWTDSASQPADWISRIR